ncbi:MAG TPA: SUMF1/EgtB/PvdO family nonheme iron enzyme, partial [Acidimicrobiales bacterium]|nr:SUMF1/EgtB/PvdO family nonheme iron enzyme [Acidimicrobiales bacterium]
FQQPRNVREALPLLDLDQAHAYGDAVRTQALDRLAGADLGPDAAEPLLRHGFVHSMVAQHEHQHTETILAAVQLLPPDEGHELRASPAPCGRPVAPDEALVAAGSFTMGTSDRWALDNEGPPHQVDVAAFWIDTTPVTNARYRSFIDAGGYDDPSLWTTAGWTWRQEAALSAPQFWRSDGDGWWRLRFGTMEELPADEPVQHVCWYEADAFARWAGRRLPTEAEWEKAALHDPDTGSSRRWPWGELEPTTAHANLGYGLLGPAPVGAYPDGVSPSGCHQMVGDVWEWLASDFRPYPGFRAHPYPEYSEVFFGSGHKMLRGGSWATHPSVGRTTFRNWDLPIRRQIFAGFRTARTA